MKSISNHQPRVSNRSNATLRAVFVLILTMFNTITNAQSWISSLSTNQHVSSDKVQFVENGSKVTVDIPIYGDRYHAQAVGVYVSIYDENGTYEKWQPLMVFGYDNDVNSFFSPDSYYTEKKDMSNPHYKNYDGESYTWSYIGMDYWERRDAEGQIHVSGLYQDSDNMYYLTVEVDFGAMTNNLTHNKILHLGVEGNVRVDGENKLIKSSNEDYVTENIGDKVVDIVYSEITSTGQARLWFNAESLTNSDYFQHIEYLDIDYSLDGGSWKGLAYMRHRGLHQNVNPWPTEVSIDLNDGYTLFFENAEGERDGPLSYHVYEQDEQNRIELRLDMLDVPRFRDAETVQFRIRGDLRARSEFENNTVPIPAVLSDQIVVSEDDDNPADELDLTVSEFTDAGNVVLGFNLASYDNEERVDHIGCVSVFAQVDGGSWEKIATVRHPSDIFSGSDCNPLDNPYQTGDFTTPGGDPFTFATAEGVYVFPRGGNYYSSPNDVTFESGDNPMIHFSHYIDPEDFGKEINYKLGGIYWFRDHYDYNKQVQLWNNYGTSAQADAYSAALSSIPDIGAPLVNYSESQCAINLSWEEPEDFGGENSRHQILIYRNGVQIAALDAHSVTAFADTDIGRGETYAYQIAVGYSRYLNGPLKGNLSSAVDMQFPIPQAPAGIGTSQADCDGSIEISWLWQGATNPDAFVIQRKAEGTGFETIVDTLDGSYRDYTDTEVTEGVQYSYRLAAKEGICNFLGEFSPVRTHSRDTIDLSPTITKGALKTSKGYFADRTELFWELTGVNEAYVNRFRVYARELGTSSTPALIESLQREDRSWFHERGEAKTIYEYFVTTERVIETECGFETTRSFDIEAVNGLVNLHESLPDSGVAYAVGFRSPTAIVNGNITYQGGIAVPDVKVVAEPENTAPGKSLYFNGNSRVTVNASPYINVDTALTLSTWVKPTRLDPNVMLFKSGSYGLEYNGTEAFMFVRDTLDQTAHVIKVPSTDYKIGNWVNLTCTYSSASGALNLYVNGEKTGETVFVPEGRRIINQTQEPFLIGDYTSPGYEFQGNMDEIRVYNRALSAVEVQREYGRITSTGSNGLVAYWKIQEGFGQNIYDAAHSGSYYFKHDGVLSNGVIWSEDVPSTAQLGLAAFTNSYGNYSLEGIPYAGNGQNFRVIPTITLSGVVHEFDPNAKSVFLGEGNTVENGVDFEDISSFEVSGRIVYDFEDETGSGTKSVGSAGVQIFMDGTTPLLDENENPIVTDSDGYFNVSIPIGLHYISFEKDNHTISDGSRWPSVGFHNFQAGVSGITLYDQTLHKFVGTVAGGTSASDHGIYSIYQINNLGEAYFDITSSDNIVSRRVETDSLSGVFEVELPPLQYNLSSVKWSIDDLDIVASSDIQPINLASEASYSGKYELDSTLTPILVQNYPEAASEAAIKDFRVDSISATQIFYSWSLNASGMVSENHIWVNDTDTVTYFVDLNSGGFTTGMRSANVVYTGTNAYNENDELPNALLIQFKNAADEVFEVGVEFNGFTPKTLYQYDTTGYEYVKDSIFYNTRRDFIYRELPTLEVVTAGDTLFSGESTYGNVASEDLTVDLEQLSYPTFFTNDFYQLEIRANEIYTNKDNGVQSEIPVTDGNIIVNNGIGTSFIYGEDGRKQYGQGSRKSLNEEGVATYDFVGGDPSFVQVTSTGQEQNSFTKTINVSLEVDGQSVTWPADPTNDPQRAYVLGIQAIPGANFVTAAPETVEFILRDPPGSDSYAYREAGTTFSVSEEFIGSGFGGIDGSLGGGVGFDLAGGGSFGGHIEGGGTVEATAQIGMKMELEASSGATVERSLEATETITTSDQPIEIGASDVFVAKSHNLETGYAMRVQPLPLDECGGNCFGDTITISNGNQFQMGVSVVSYINPEGFPTYVVYTQNHIETVLIPDLKELRNTILTENPGYTSHLTPDHELYGTNNDDLKWGALVSTSDYIKTEAADLSGSSYTFDNGGDDTRVDSIRFFNQQIRLWEEALAFNEIEKWAAFNAGNHENVSLASGVQLERSQTNTASSVSMISLETSMALTLDVDVSINAIVAVRANLDAELGLKTTSTSTRGQESANTFGYVLQDSDENDAYSIDIASGVGGNSPVFSTVAGQSSCPFEPGLEMKYATPEFIDRAIIDRQALIEKLTKSKNITDILKTQVEEEIQSIQDDVKNLEADVKKYTESQIELIKAKADINKIFNDLQTIVKEVGENAANALVQKAVGPVVGGVNDFIGTLQDIRIPIPFSSGISPFESIPKIPEPTTTGDFVFDFNQMEDIMLKRLKDAEKVATETINRTTELITQVQNKIKKRLLDLNNLTIRLKAYELDLESINNEIDAVNEQIVQFQQLQGVLQSSTEPIKLSNSTLQREKPTLQINGAKTAQVYNVPADESANFRLLLGNESETGDAQYYAIEVLDESNPNGLVLKIDGENVSSPKEYLVNGGSSITKVMTVERGPFEYDYEDIQVVIHSTCQYDPTSNTELIVDTVSFDVKFIPVCSDVAILSPQDNWVGNNSSNGILPIHIGEYDINSTGLEYIQIKYKASSSADWLEMVRYFRDENITEWESGNPTLPQTGNEFIYDWNFAELGILDGSYDIQVVSVCALAESKSEIFSGIIDRVSPHPFGTPEPADGIYSAGDEISIQFNEPLNEGLIRPSDFKIRGVLNGGEIRHNASVYFGGQADQYMEIPQGLDFTRKSFTIEMYVKRAASGEEVLFAQGGAANRSIRMGIDANDFPFMSIDGQTLTATTGVTDNMWHHLAFVYNHGTGDALIYDNATNIGVDNSFESDYQSGGRVFIAKSTFGDELPFHGNIHELRVWNTPLSEAEINLAATNRMKANERGLVGNWMMEEANGDIAQDHVRSKHAMVYGQWTIEPGGLAYQFEGSATVEAQSPSFSRSSDFTIEFWVNGAAVTDSVTFISNGTGDGQDANNSGWAIGVDAQAQLIVKSNGKVITTEAIVLDNSWHHVTVSLNRVGNLTCFVDGSEVGKLSARQFQGFGGSKLVLGARGWFDGSIETSDQYFTGLMDEVRIWALARRADDINTDIQNKLNGDETGLVLYYPFESYHDIGGGILSPQAESENQSTTALSQANTLQGTQAGQFITNTPAIKLPRPVESVAFNYSINGDMVILSPTVDPGEIEDVILTVSVKNLQDVNGNAMVSPTSWTAYVDRSTLNWVEIEKTLEIPLGDGLSFEATIYNRGGNVENFTLTNLPNWLSASPSSGSVAPLESQVISFTVSDATNIGSYVQDVVMENSFGFDEKLLLNLNVYQPSPEDWVVNPADYEYSMSVLSRVRIESEFSRDENDLVAAFVNGECRGVASLEYAASQDNFQAFMSVYSNELSGEEITYRIWNASEGLVHTFVTASTSEVETFKTDAFYGSVIDPVIFDGGINIQSTREIVTGWQWLSFNLTSGDMSTVADLMADFPSSEGDQVKGVEHYDQYDPTNGWLGTISSNGGIQPNEMYKFKMANPGKLKFRGEPIDPTASPIPLITGWNWISFLGQNLIPINEALANVTGLSEGDIIKSQKQFATYAGDGVGWVGSLTTMVPGEGYLYRAASDGSIVYPRVASTGRVASPDYNYLVQENHSVNPANYPNQMNMIIELEGSSSADYLVAYHDGKVVGIAQPADNPFRDKLNFYLSVFGKNEGTISFAGVNDGDEFDLFGQDEVVFSPTAYYGTLHEPYLLAGAPLSSAEVTGVELFPNPTSNRVNVLLNRKDITALSLLTLSGQLLDVKNVSDETNVVFDLSQLSKGVYLLKLEGPGLVESIRIIKE